MQQERENEQPASSHQPKNRIVSWATWVPSLDCLCSGIPYLLHCLFSDTASPTLLGSSQPMSFWMFLTLNKGRISPRAALQMVSITFCSPQGLPPSTRPGEKGKQMLDVFFHHPPAGGRTSPHNKAHIMQTRTGKWLPTAVSPWPLPQAASPRHRRQIQHEVGHSHLCPEQRAILVSKALHRKGFITHCLFLFSNFGS